MGRSVGWWVGGIVLTAALAVTAISAPLALLAIPGIASVFALFRYPWMRVLFFIVGALLVFQTSNGISVPKLVYFGGVAAALVVALVQMRNTLATEWGRAMKPALWAAALLGAWILFVTLPYSVIGQQIPLSDWARDAVTSLLISAGVVIGVDGVPSFSLNWARAAGIGTGVLVAFGFASRWIQLRGFGDATAAQSLLSSFSGLALPLTLAFCLALVGRGIRFRWLMVGFAFLIAVLVTGTRTGVVFGVGFIGIVGSATRQRVPALKSALSLVIMTGMIAISLPIAGSMFSSADFISGRFQAAVSALSGGVTLDQSGALRVRAYEYAASIWREYPLLGQGVGHVFPDPSTGGLTSGFSLDTPLAYLAKFGILGTLVLAAAVIVIFRTCIRQAGFTWQLEQTAVRGAAVTMIFLLPFGMPTEDKGFALSICLAILLVSVARSRETLMRGAAIEKDRDRSPFPKSIGSC